MNTSKRRAALASIISLSLLAAACGGDDEESTTETTSAPAVETTEAAAADTTAAAGTDTTDTTAASGGGDVELAGGEVFVTGSSTVEPISIRVGELAAELSGGDLAVTVEGPGTGDGFQKFCAGEGDMTGASRAIRDEEAQLCADNGIEFVELEVAFDGLTVATSPANTAIECLDNAAIYSLVGPESEGFENWSDANDLAAELGSAFAPFPDAPLVVNGPGEESGTYDTFVEFAISDIAEARGTDEFTRADYASSPNDNLIVEGIEGSDTSFGWVGYAFYKAEEGRMKAISIADEEGECIAPTEETIADGSYPYSRSLYLYVNTAKAAENPAVASYAQLYLSDQGLIDQVAAAGYVSLPADRIEATRSAWTL